MRTLGFDLKNEEIKAFLERYNSKEAEHPSVTYEQFVEIMTDKIGQRTYVDEVSYGFKLFDEERNGRISLRNLRRMAN